MRSFRAASTAWLVLLIVLPSGPVNAHPMGNFSINHYSRIEIHESGLSIRYIIDMAEIPTVSERAAMDTNSDGRISETERAAYLSSAATRLRNGITLRLNGKAISLDVKPVGIEFVPGAGGLVTTRMTLDMAAVAPGSHFANGDTIDYRDCNYDARTGWKEIIAVPAVGISVTESDVRTTDVSRQLTVYPADATSAPPQQAEAHFVIQKGNTSGPAHAASVGPNRIIPTSGSPVAPSAGSGNTPRDAFTQAISRGNLTAGVVILSLLIAFGFGALHALSPGHGKAMMAAYLVGARGTAIHAVMLGLVVTLTHTIGVFALGLVMLFAARYVVPERLYPMLSGISGLTIAVMGAILLRQRWIGASSPEPDIYDHNGANDNIPLSDGERRSRFTEPKDTGPLSVRSLIALGITGGILPCPSALVVMLSAVALQRVGFGLMLIVAFSIGLAVVLTGIGVCVVYMRGLTDRISSRGRLLQHLPVISAAFVMLIGIILVFKSLRGGGY